ncbi:g6688 [Coccomyxa viridis]|uniref:DNA (cytosine-5)-methyltransferase n=1 Tax=Coccomyxa viridis TaxID=1274662 RepID=A0ABP1FVZ8_9CHLO
MASSADLECWRALGGKVTEVKKRKRFISPTGEEYSSWQAASDYLKANGSGRQVAQGKKLYREKGGQLKESKEDRILVREVLPAKDEAEAVAQLAAGRGKPLFRLTDFAVVDEHGQHQPLESHGVRLEKLFLSGTLYPSDGQISKQQGRLVTRFGPLKSWKITAKADSYQVCVSTSAADYIVSKPKGTYKKMYCYLSEQADLAVERILLPCLGGDAQASFDEVVARIARAKVGKTYSGPREALRLTGKFVLSHLLEATKAGPDLSSSPFVIGLHQEMAGITFMGPRSKGITICDVADRTTEVMHPDAQPDGAMEADLDFARQLQAKLDAEEARGGASNRHQAGKGAAYIKISESEIANDYPEPAQYEKEEEETDELLLMDEEMLDAPPEDLPRRLLTNFAVYNAEGLYASLELLPMWSGIESDVQLFASGRVLHDDGEWAGGQSLGEGSGSGGSNEVGREPEEEGMWLALSQIQEWVVEYGCDMLFITFRTDVAWYRLSKPTAAYAPWFNVILKCARLAVSVLTMLSNEARASRLSYNDIVKRLAATEDTHPTFISKKAELVERFVVVHGQIILNQFKSFPKKSVANSAFVSGLKGKMELRRHCKLYARPQPKARVRGLRANPMRHHAARQKPMTATATRMVKAIWHAYFVRTGIQLPGAEPADADLPENGTSAVDDDVNAEDDEAPEEDALAKPVLVSQPPAAVAPRKLASSSIAFIGKPLRAAGGKSFHRSVKAGDLEVSLGDIVAITPRDEDSADEAHAQICMIQALWQTPKAKMMQVRLFVRGAETVLSDAANPEELFATEDFETRNITSLVDKVKAERLKREFNSFKIFMKQLDEKAPPGAQEGVEVTAFFYRSLYLPHKGMFSELPADLSLGDIQKEAEESNAGVTGKKAGNGGFIKDALAYRVGDCFYVSPDTFDQIEDPDALKPEVPAYLAKSRFHKGGANAGLRAFGVAKLLAVQKADGQEVRTVKVQRFYRPEDISKDLGYRSDFWDIYASAEQEEVEVDVGDIHHKCLVQRSGSPADRDSFVCVGSYSRKHNKVGHPPEEYAAACSSPGESVNKAGGGLPSETAGKSSTMVPTRPAGASGHVAKLATMDIFAGCGGLTCGLHKAGAAETRWSIEYEQPAAEAFKLNNPEAHTFCDNCNVLLAAAMEKAGASEYCDASVEAREAAEKLGAETTANLPGPGEVDFLCGGPPCQGYSGMNRFNKGSWSMVQNSMVMAYLSYADFYRPRYFLLENVRNFVSHNKSHAFRLTLRSLLDMGYQVRFGVLNAGNFGVSQSRKRTFIWGVAPGSVLPEWPQPLHVFRSPQLTIKLPGGAEYTAVPQRDGAPLRAITVRDAIGDLPPITNGSDKVEMEYSGPPISAFQGQIRGSSTLLRDHISKEMNELNLERCRCIPKLTPGADWRVLQEIIEQHPERTLYKGQPLVPWCLPNTADRHNGWRGLFGRLDYDGHFPTSVTDPQPMGKVGQVFHPEQDRIVSVRECARAQGFPDDFCFYGNVHSKHRQIGNAVPVPLAYSLGRQLKAALEETAGKEAQALLAAQM